MRHLELLHLIPELVHEAVVVIVAESALDPAGQRRQLVVVVGARLGGRDGLLEVGKQVFQGLVHQGGAYSPGSDAGDASPVGRLIVAVLIDDCPSTRPRRARRRGVVMGAGVAAVLVLAAACSGGKAGPASDAVDDRAAPNSVPLPTIEGGVELAKVDLRAVLVAEGLSFGQALPSEQAAADAFTEDTEVVSAVARHVLSVASKRLVARVVVLELDGPEIFDVGVLDGFVRGVIGAYGDGPVEEVEMGAQMTFRSVGEASTAHGFRLGNLLVVVLAPVSEDATLVVERQVSARAAGGLGAADPATPMYVRSADAAFVAVPTVSFLPIPPPEDEPPPAPPSFPGATGMQGRYGVVAGERRTVAWSFTVDPGTYPSAERLEPAIAALVTARAGGTVAKITEVLDRVVLAADAAPGVEGALAARAFRHGALVVLVEGRDAAQLDAVVSDWISALA